MLILLKIKKKTVALLAEGVDRNKEVNALFNNIRVALLAEGVDRNGKVLDAAPDVRVALLAEGVDRNRNTATAKPTEAGRPPRGGRG